MSFVKEEITVYERTTKKRRRATLTAPTMKRDKRKTQSSTCANFIHQKDAFIAMKVVEFLLRYGAPIYTVHDNFITTPPYIRIVPDIYIKVFLEMGSPLKMINQFTSMNLIDPYYHTRDIDNLSPLYYHNNICIMLSDYLTDYLNSFSPTINKKIWDKKVSDFVQYYNNYVEAVCGNQVIDSEEKYRKFKELLENRSHNYSVHY